jgi:DNA-binding NtrC family response regulator
MDEIGDMPKSIQTRLLRVMEYGDVRPEGMDEGYEVNVRIVAATNKNIRKRVEKNLFKMDFLNRFTLKINLPPLRDHKEDILDLIQHFGGNELHLSEDCIMKFQTEDWKLGNVRELKAKVDAAKTVKQDELIEWEDIPQTAISILNEANAISLPDLPLPLPLKSNKEYDYNDAIIDKARDFAENDEEVDRLLGQGGQRIEANRKQRKKLKK